LGSLGSGYVLLEGAGECSIKPLVSISYGDGYYSNSSKQRSILKDSIIIDLKEISINTRIWVH